VVLSHAAAPPPPLRRRRRCADAAPPSAVRRSVRSHYWPTLNMNPNPHSLPGLTTASTGSTGSSPRHATAQLRGPLELLPVS